MRFPEYIFDTLTVAQRDRNRNNHPDYRKREDNNYLNPHQKASIFLWDSLAKEIKRTLPYLKTNSRKWQISGTLDKDFWIRFYDYDREKSASSISISIDINEIDVYLEWFRNNAKKSTNTIEQHNSWIQFIPQWTLENNIDPYKYMVWVNNENPNPISLHDFMQMGEGYLTKIREQKENPEFSFRVGVKYSKSEVLALDDCVSEFTEIIDQLYDLYEVTVGDTSKPIDTINTLSEPMYEGGISKQLVNKYERRRKLRDACIQEYGLTCYACGFNFEQFYGRKGKGYIQVHHETPLHSLKGRVTAIDPKKDMKPLCANCHCIIHYKGLISVEELKSIIEERK